MEGVNPLISNEDLGVEIDGNEQLPTITFPDKYTIEVKPDGIMGMYLIRDPRGDKAFKDINDEPIMLSLQTKVGREIRKHLNPENKFSKKAIEEDFSKLKKTLQISYDQQVIDKRAKEKAEKEEKEEYLQNKIFDAKELLKNKQHPLIYIASLISWLTAGERTNIMLTFIAYASQVILKNPISVIGLGEGASGKTHIEEVAMRLIPEEFIRHEKSVTEAAMFNRAKEDPWYYDGCIVNYGDLGGRNSQDFIMEAKNLLKELQSDGFINKPLNIPTKDDGWIPIDLTLRGKPALTYTTVPGFEFDDQEMSRSIFITPRMDNREIFHSFKQTLELKLGRTYKQLKHYEEEAEIVKYIVYAIREKIEEITIINPYTSSVINFLGESEFFKRDFDKYNTILKTITAFNCFNHPLFELDGEFVLFTSLDDIQIFISLLEVYHESISVNISPKAAEILNDLRNNMDEWIFDNKVPENGALTTNEYYEISGTKLSKRSIQRYFGELNRAGFLKVVHKEGNSNLYGLSEKLLADLEENLLTLKEDQRNLIKWELGDAALRFIEGDALTDNLNILLPDPDVGVPPWEDEDERH